MILPSNEGRFYASPTFCQGPTGHHFSDTCTGINLRWETLRKARNFMAKDGTHTITVLDYQLCNFNLTTLRRSRNGYILSASTAAIGFNFKAKVVDVTGPTHITDILTKEVALYAALNKLQGTVIPVWGLRSLGNTLYAEDVGESIDHIYPNATPTGLRYPQISKLTWCGSRA